MAASRSFHRCPSQKPYFRNVLDAIRILAEKALERNIALQDANEDIADQVLLWDGENLNPEMVESIATMKPYTSL